MIGHRLRVEQRSDAYGQDITVEGICVGVHATGGAWENPILLAIRLDDDQIVIRRWACASKVIDLGYPAKYRPPYSIGADKAMHVIVDFDAGTDASA